MQDDKNIRCIEEHRKELLRQAEQYRRARQAVSGRHLEANLWRQAREKLKALLTSMVCFFQTRILSRLSSSIPPACPSPCGQ